MQSDSIEEGSDGDSNNHHDRENFLRINPESDEEELMIQVEDHYADLGDGIILETEEKSSSAYRYFPPLFCRVAKTTRP